MLYNDIYVIYDIYICYMYISYNTYMHIYVYIYILEIKYSGCIYSVQPMKVIIITLQITGGKTHQKQHSSKTLKPLI